MTAGDNSYYGGKSGAGTYQTIINKIPPHKVYVELFGGKAGIFRAKRKAQTSIILEKDRDLMPYYKEIGLEEVFRPVDLYRRAALGAGEICFNVDTLKFMDYNSFQRELDRPDVFMYVDPPYLLDTRKDKRPTYKHEMTMDDHIFLLESLYCFQFAKIAISCYPNEIYPEQLWRGKEWNLFEFESMTRKGKAKEQLWMNYDEPEQLHDYQHVGENFTERQRIKRKVTRELEKLKGLPVLERNAIIQAILREFDR